MPTPALALVALAGVFAAGPPAAAPPVPLLPGIVDSPDTEVRPAFSPDGRCILWGSIGAPKTAWRILQTCRDGAGWSRPEAVSFDGPDNDFDPAFSPDGRTVYFFSNRPGGQGGDDLYAVDRDPATGAFGAPRNLGPGVNGPLDDFDATLLADGRTLVFASGDLKAESRVTLHSARRGGDGRFGSHKALAAPVNCSEAMNNGPAVDPGRPGVLFYSAYCPTLGPGRMDIFEVPAPTP